MQTVLPNHVKTKLSSKVDVPLISVTPEEYVSAAIKTVGIEFTTAGHWRHKAFSALQSYIAFAFGEVINIKLSYMWANKCRNSYNESMNM